MNFNIVNNNANLFYNGHATSKYQRIWMRCRLLAIQDLQNQQPSNQLSIAVFNALRCWKMRRKNIFNQQTVHSALCNAWGYLRQLPDLDSLNTQHSLLLENAYDSLKLIASKPTVTIRTKAMLLTWAGFPAFDGNARKHGRRSHIGVLNQKKVWPWGTNQTYISAQEFSLAAINIANDYQRSILPFNPPNGVTHGRHLDAALFIGPV
jgi:hypothetical protein